MLELKVHSYTPLAILEVISPGDSGILGVCSSSVVVWMTSHCTRKPATLIIPPHRVECKQERLEGCPLACHSQVPACAPLR